MATSKVLRWSGLAAMLGGLFMIVGSVNWEEPPWMWFGSLGSLLLVFGMMGIYAVQIEASGLTGFLGFVALAAGTMLLMGQGNLWGVEFWLLGSLLSAVGLILLGVGTLAAGKFPRWIAWLWFAAVVVGLPSLALPALQGPLGMLGSAAGAVGFASAGYFLWTGRK